MRITYQGSPGAMLRKIGLKKAVSESLALPKKLMPESSKGADRMELAKMTGITPPELTLSGR